MLSLGFPVLGIAWPQALLSSSCNPAILQSCNPAILQSCNFWF
jgi:hypothetical protein